MSTILIVITALVTLVTAIYAIFKIRYQYWAKRGIPNPDSPIPFGVKITRNGKRILFTELLNESYVRFKGQAPFYGMFMFLRPFVVALDLEFVNHVLVKDFSVFHDRGVYSNERHDPLSAHLFSLSGKRWKTLRTKLTPTFTSGKMKFMCPTILKVGQELDETLGEIIKSDPIVELKQLLARFTTDVIGTCAFGIECNSLKDPDAEFRQAGRSALGPPRYSFFGRLLIAQFPEFARKLGVKTVRPGVSEFFMKIVTETVDYRENNNVRRNDFMDLLIQLKNADETKGEFERLTLNQVAAQVFLFFLAGFETSASTMTFALYELAINQVIQEKVRNEIDEVLEKNGGEFTYEAMMSMQYLDCVINETLRKHPPVGTLIRIASEDYPVPTTDVVLKKGTLVFIPVWSVHHDSDIYPEPDVFDPDRFTPEEVRKRHAMAFLGFGNGPRNCIGMRFGQMQARIGLISLLRKYRFKSCSKTLNPMRYSTTEAVLSPDGGLYLEVESI